jgi:heme-degrading monooxygenase HmoA
MHMRIVWGKILPGQWDAFEAAFKKALEIRGEPKGLKSQWLLRDQNDPDAGYAISQWESEEDMRAFWDSQKRSDAMAVIQPFFVNQFTITNCAIRGKSLSRRRKTGDADRWLQLDPFAHRHRRSSCAIRTGSARVY